MKDGVVNVLKMPGMTSHDVVNRLRKIYHTKKVGHTGTLDPDAMGVLPVCVGQATRLAEYLVDKDKEYRVLMKFGAATTTADASGEKTAEAALPTLSREEFAAICQSFIGEIEQVPPMYSAVKKDGVPLYKLARQGIAVEVEPRRVQIYDIKILLYNSESAMLDVRCSKGTYIRTLCADIAQACGSLGYMAMLIRNRSGVYKIDEAVRLELLEQSDDPEQYILPFNRVLADVVTITVADSALQAKLQNGMAVAADYPAGAKDDDLAQAQSAQGEMLAIGYLKENKFYPHKVFKVGDGDAAIQ